MCGAVVWGPPRGHRQTFRPHHIPHCPAPRPGQTQVSSTFQTCYVILMKLLLSSYDGICMHVFFSCFFFSDLSLSTSSTCLKYLRLYIFIYSTNLQFMFLLNACLFPFILLYLSLFQMCLIFACYTKVFSYPL